MEGWSGGLGTEGVLVGLGLKGQVLVGLGIRDLVKQGFERTKISGSKSKGVWIQRLGWGLS